MPDSKITALTALTSADPANDMFPIVDVSDTSMAASGTTKRISINNLLAASGTATLASATITGDLTVDTSTLKVDSANNRVGVLTATPGYPLHVNGTDATNVLFNGATKGVRFGASASKYSITGVDNTGAATFQPLAIGGASLEFQIGSTTHFAIDASGIATWSNVGGVAGTAMTLNASGLTMSTGSLNSQYWYGINATSMISSGSGSWPLLFGINGSEKARIDSSGNLGIGVTPSAGGSAYYKTLEIGKAGCGLFTAAASLTASELTYLSGNGVLAYNSGPEWTYGNNGAAAIYGIEDGVHKWYNATTGTAGVVFTPTQSMTLTAGGDLLVKKTASGGTTLGVELLATGQINGATANQDNLNIYNTTAAAYRFYVNAAGTVFATNTTISAISDARFKENVQDIDVGLGAILALKPRKFDWKDGKGKNIKGDRGFIAQEFETVFPNLIDEWKENAPEGEAPYKSVRQDLIPVLVKAIQELAAEVNALKNA